MLPILILKVNIPASSMLRKTLLCSIRRHIMTYLIMGLLFLAFDRKGEKRTRSRVSPKPWRLRKIAGISAIIAALTSLSGPQIVYADLQLCSLPELASVKRAYYGTNPWINWSSMSNQSYLTVCTDDGPSPTLSMTVQCVLPLDDSAQLGILGNEFPNTIQPVPVDGVDCFIPVPGLGGTWWWIHSRLEPLQPGSGVSTFYLVGRGGADNLMGIQDDLVHNVIFGDYTCGFVENEDRIPCAPIPPSDLHAGGDILVGGPGCDWLVGDDGNDWVFGAAGNDYLVGGTMSCLETDDPDEDYIFGEEGNDCLFGEKCEDSPGTIWENVDDFLIGGVGNDNLNGGPGDDHLFGDTIQEGLGERDFLCGSTGTDVFYAQFPDQVFYDEGEYGSENFGIVAPASEITTIYKTDFTGRSCLPYLPTSPYELSTCGECP
jgi:hypothetical protein